MITWVGLIWEDFLEEVWLEEALQGGAEKHERSLTANFWAEKARLSAFLTHLFPFPYRQRPDSTGLDMQTLRTGDWMFILV